MIFLWSHTEQLVYKVSSINCSGGYKETKSFNRVVSKYSQLNLLGLGENVFMHVYNSLLKRLRICYHETGCYVEQLILLTVLLLFLP